MWSRCATDSFQFKKNKEKVFDLNLIDLTSYKFYLHVFLFNDLISGVYFAVHSVEAIKLVGSQTDWEACICGILDRKNSIRAFCRGGQTNRIEIVMSGTRVFSPRDPDFQNRADAIWWQPGLKCFSLCELSCSEWLTQFSCFPAIGHTKLVESGWLGLGESEDVREEVVAILKPAFITFCPWRQISV